MPQPAVDPDTTYLLSLEAVRDRAQVVHQIALDGRLNSFEYDAGSMPAVADFVIDIINVGCCP